MNHKKRHSTSFFYPLFMLIFFVSFNGFTQNNKKTDSIRKVVSKIVSEAIKIEKLKDSTAVYGFAVKLNVNFVKGLQQVNLAVSSTPIANAIDLKLLEKLKKVDYSLFIDHKRESNLYFKVGVFVSDSKYHPQLIKLDDVFEFTTNLFLKDEFKMINLGSTLIKLDQKVYH